MFRAELTPVAIVAVTLNVLASRRANDADPHDGTHKLSNADTMPPQGLAKPGTGSPGLLVFRSILSSASAPGANTAPAAKSQSPAPVIATSASGGKLANGIWMPGVLMPDFR